MSLRGLIFYTIFLCHSFSCSSVKHTQQKNVSNSIAGKFLITFYNIETGELLDDSKISSRTIADLGNISNQMLDEIKVIQTVFKNPFQQTSDLKYSIVIKPASNPNMVSDCSENKIIINSGILKSVLVKSLEHIFSDSTFSHIVNQVGFFNFLYLLKENKVTRLKSFLHFLYNSNYHNYNSFDDFFNKTDQQKQLDFVNEILSLIDSGIQNFLTFLLSHEIYHLHEGCDIALEYEINADCYAAIQLVNIERYNYGVDIKRRSGYLNHVTSNFLDIVYYVYADSILNEHIALGLYPPLEKRINLIDSSLRSKGITYGIRINSKSFPFF